MSPNRTEQQAEGVARVVNQHGWEATLIVTGKQHSARELVDRKEGSLWNTQT